MKDRFKFPVENKNEKVLVARVPLEFLPKIEKKDVIFFVEVDKKKFDGEDLLAQLNFIGSTCNHCYIVVADELQRFNNFLDSEEDARRISIEAGDNWIKKYTDLFEKKMNNGRYNFIRWNELVNHKEFYLKKQEILSKLDSDHEYEAALLVSVEEYRKRQDSREHKKTNTEISRDIILQNGRSYLIEECAVFSLMPDLYMSHILYPGAPSPIIKQTFEKLINPFYENPLEWIPIRFKRVSAYEKIITDRKKIIDKILFFMADKKDEALYEEKVIKLLIDVIGLCLSGYTSNEDKRVFLENFWKKLKFEFLSNKINSNASEGVGLKKV